MSAAKKIRKKRPKVEVEDPNEGALSKAHYYFVRRVPASSRAALS
jgi:hypothetical protein